MKKTVCILISILMLMTSFCIFGAAEGAENNVYVFETEDVCYTIEFNDNNLNNEQQIIVAEKLAFQQDEGSAQTYGLGCILFGHDYLYTTSNVITHKARTAKPRCKQETYNVKYCEDCDFIEETLISTTYINCCS